MSTHGIADSWTKVHSRNNRMKNLRSRRHELLSYKRRRQKLFLQDSYSNNFINYFFACIM